MFSMVLTFFCALISGCVLTPVARMVARKIGAVDRPDGKRKLQTAPVPLLGGVAVYVAFLVGLFVADMVTTTNGGGDANSSFPWVLALAAGFVCLIGCIDDSLDLRPRFKLLLQCVSTLPIILAGYYVERITLFGFPMELGWIGIPLTMLWIVACVNALNLLDGMDGLASTVGVSSAVMIALIALGNDNISGAIVASALVGSLVAFLIYNLPPASIYLGDSGSMVIGLVIGVLAIQGTQKTTATLSIAVPALVMTIPMLDTVLAIVRRWLTGRRFDVADRGHLHHRLLDQGLSKWQALRIIGVLCLSTGAAAATAVYLRSEVIAWIAGITVVALAVRHQYIGHHELSLVKLSVAALLTRLGSRLIDGKNSNLRIRTADLAAIPFDKCWQMLKEEAVAQEASSLTIVIGSHEPPSRTFSWQQSDNDEPRSSGWLFSTRHISAAGEFCEFTVAGSNDTRGQQLALLQLADVLKLVEEYWANAMSEPSSMANETLSIEQGRAAKSLVEESDRKRAA